MIINFINKKLQTCTTNLAERKKIIHTEIYYLYMFFILSYFFKYTLLTLLEKGFTISYEKGKIKRKNLPKVTYPYYSPSGILTNDMLGCRTFAMSQ